MTITRAAAAAFTLLLATTNSVGASTQPVAEPLVAIWSSVGLADLTPDRATALSKTTPGGLRALFVPRAALSDEGYGGQSLYAQLDAAGLAGSVAPELAGALDRVPSGTTLTMLSSQSFGLPNGHVDVMNHDDGDCTGAPGCATITVSIEMTGVGAKCPGPTIFGICPVIAPPLPEFKFHTEQWVTVSRTDNAIDTLYPSRPHFRSTNGGDWGHRFHVVTLNPNEPGAGAGYLATSDGEWAPVNPGSISIPPGTTFDYDTTLISGFCLRWDVRYPNGAFGSRQDNFQLRADVTLGAFTGHQWIHNEGICTL